ncbi:hypothetical protein PIB30_105541, partial [Stylosanthes scabra]|nr:hypothetical protein [Stylosanthes scabra]
LGQKRELEKLEPHLRRPLTENVTHHLRLTVTSPSPAKDCCAAVAFPVASGPCGSSSFSQSCQNPNAAVAVNFLSRSQFSVQLPLCLSL